MPDHDTPRRSGAHADEAVRRTDTTNPRRSRERALKVLFQADLRGESPVETLRRIAGDDAALAILDDLDLPDADQDVIDRARQARLDAEAGTTLTPETRAEPLDGFSRVLVEGVADHRDEIDRLISQFARKWSIHRMPVVDRNVLRLATYELLHEDTAPPVVIDEAVELAKALSTDNSGRYVNGVIDSIRKDIEQRRGGAA